MSQHTTRAQRMTQPRAGDAVRMLAEASGGCIRPVQLRRTNLDTGQAEQVIVPCGSTLESVCRACAERCQSLRVQQCRDGWHLEDEPTAPPPAPDDWQTWLLEKRAELQQQHDQAAALGEDTTGLDELLAELDTELARPGSAASPTPAMRKPRAVTARLAVARTPRTFPAVRSRRARLGRSTPHPMAGPTDRPCFSLSPWSDQLPVWHAASGSYLDPATGEVLPTWDQALDAISPHDQPLHIARFGAKFDAQGVLAGSKDSGRCIRYLTKYLTKQISGCHQADSPAQDQHAARLVDELRYEPCSPTCANWLRYGIQPRNPREGMRPGACKGKAHRADNLGYAGRRVLVSRKWSGKTLADHRGDRKAWLLSMLGLPDPDDTGRYRWERVLPSDEDFIRTAGECCTSWPTARGGESRSPKLGEEQRRSTPFR